MNGEEVKLNDKYKRQKMISLLLFQREEILLHSLSHPPTYKVCEFNKKKSISTTHNRFSFLMDDKWKLLKCGNMWCTFTSTFLYLTKQTSQIISSFFCCCLSKCEFKDALWYGAESADDMIYLNFIFLVILWSFFKYFFLFSFCRWYNFSSRQCQPTWLTSPGDTIHCTLVCLFVRSFVRTSHHSDLQFIPAERQNTFTVYTENVF